MKKQKLIIGICTPVALAGVAAATAGVVIGLSNNQNVGDYKITFDAGKGHFKNANNVSKMVFDNQTLDRTAQPEVESDNSDELFSGWVDESGKPVTGTHAFHRNTKLTAVYNSGTVGDYCQVTFLPGSDASVVLQGNTSVAVKKGYLFFMINRPEATANKKYFNHWVYAEDVYEKETKIHSAGDKISERDEIRTNIKLQPDWTQAVTVTWQAGEDAYIKRGSNTTTLAYGQPFDKFNQPEVASSKGAIFQGWYHDDGTKFTPTEPITSDVKATAKWGSPKAVDGFVTLSFVDNDTEGQPDVDFAPSPFQVIKENDTWGNTQRPTVTTTSGNWEMAVDDNKQDIWEVKGGKYSGWTKLEKTSDFPKLPSETDSYQIRPVMVSAIKGIDIVGEDTLLPEDYNMKYLAPITGGNSQEVSWKILKSISKSREGVITETEFAEGEAPAKIVSNPDGSGTVTVNSIDETGVRNFVIKATSVANTDIVNYKQIYIDMPYESTRNGYNKLVWYHKDYGSIPVEGGLAGLRWVSLNPSELCVKLDGKEGYDATFLADRTRVAKLYRSTDFPQTLYLGRGINIIPEQFMIDWTGFNGEINLGDQVTEIQSSFMENCTKFNKQINIPNVNKIGNHFLYNCSSFNNGNTYTAETPTGMTFSSSLKSIGEGFLGKCVKFNSPITLPTDSTYSIDGSFLYDCETFNKDITIPANVTSIGSFFMGMCGAFTSTITVNAPIDRFSQSIHDLSVDWTTAASTGVEYPIVSTGFTVSGNYKDQFIEKYPDLADTINYAFRSHKASAPTSVTGAEYVTAMKHLLIQDDQPVNARVAYTRTQKSEDYSYTQSNGIDVYQTAAGSPLYSLLSSQKGNIYELQIGDDSTPQKTLYGGLTLNVNSTGNFTGFSAAPNYYDSIENFTYIFEPTEDFFNTKFNPMTSDGWYTLTDPIEVEGEEAVVSIKFNSDKQISNVRIVAEIEGEKGESGTYTIQYGITWGKGQFTLPDVTYNKMTAADASANYSSTAIAYLSGRAYPYVFDLSNWQGKETELATAGYNGIQLHITETQAGKFSEDSYPSYINVIIYNKSKYGDIEYLDYAGNTTFKGYVKEGTLYFDTEAINWQNSYSKFTKDMIVTLAVENGETNYKSIQVEADLVKVTQSFTATPMKEIITAVNKLEAIDSPTDEQLQAFCSNFNDVEFNSKGTTVAEKLVNFLGKEHRISYKNGYEATARIVGINHDNYTDGGSTKNALFTFEVRDLVCDNDGFALKSQFAATANTKFSDSQLYKNLNTPGAGAWYDYQGNAITEAGKIASPTECVLDWFNTEDGLVGAIKTVNKKEEYISGESKTTIGNYTAKLFPLSAQEIFANVPTGISSSEGSRYEQYTAFEQEGEYTFRDNMYRWAFSGAENWDTDKWWTMSTYSTDSKIFAMYCNTAYLNEDGEYRSMYAPTECTDKLCVAYAFAI